MKVGDDDRARRAEADERRDEKRREEARRDKQQKFSELMERRRNRGRTAGGDERPRRFRESPVRGGQTGRRDRCCGGERNRPDRAPARRDSETRRCEVGDETKQRRSERAQTCSGANTERAMRDGDASAAPLQVRGQENERPNGELKKVGERIGSGRETSGTSGAGRTAPVVEEISRRILEAVRVGRDQEARRVVFLDVSVPDQGEVRIRIRREGGGVGVRMRADNDALARRLRQGTEQLRTRGADEGIEFNSIRVVR